MSNDVLDETARKNEIIASLKALRAEGQTKSRWLPTRRDLVVGVIAIAFVALAWDYYQIRRAAQMGAAAYGFLAQKYAKPAEGAK